MSLPCPTCGHADNGDSAYCLNPECGSRLAGSAPPPESADRERTAASVAREPGSDAVPSGAGIRTEASRAVAEASRAQPAVPTEPAAGAPAADPAGSAPTQPVRSPSAVSRAVLPATVALAVLLAGAVWWLGTAPSERPDQGVAVPSPGALPPEPPPVPLPSAVLTPPANTAGPGATPTSTAPRPGGVPVRAGAPARTSPTTKPPSRRPTPKSTTPSSGPYLTTSGRAVCYGSYWVVEVTAQLHQAPSAKRYGQINVSSGDGHASSAMVGTATSFHENSPNISKQRASATWWVTVARPDGSDEIRSATKTAQNPC